MILSAVNICWDPSHQPFASEGAVKIQNLNSERPASKIIRAVLRDSDIDPEDAVNYSIHRCYCRFKIKIEDDEKDETFNSESTLDELEIKEGDSVFIRKIDDREGEKLDDQGEYSSLSDVKCRWLDSSWEEEASEVDGWGRIKVEVDASEGGAIQLLKYCVQGQSADLFSFSLQR